MNQTSAEQSGISARGNIRLRPNALLANVDVNASSKNQQSSNTNTLQQVLVLNGRRVAVGLRTVCRCGWCRPSFTTACW